MRPQLLAQAQQLNLFFHILCQSDLQMQDKKQKEFLEPPLFWTVAKTFIKVINNFSVIKQILHEKCFPRNYT